MPVTRRGLQIALGLMWLLDAGLQLQPYLFGPHFAHDVIAPVAAGQPAWIAGGVHLAAHVISAAPVLTNAAFAFAQLILGAGLLWRPTVRPALVASIAWSMGVWYFGEGLGGVATGHASLITGFPGAVLLYAIVASAAWPGGVFWSQGERPRAQVIIWWVAVWVAGGIFQSLSGQAAAKQLAITIESADAGGPRWLIALDHTVARWTTAAGQLGLVALVVVEIGIGMAALGSRRAARASAALGALGAVVIWVLGEAFGQVYLGQATDPNSGPLLVLLAAAVWSAATQLDRAPLSGLRLMLPARRGHRNRRSVESTVPRSSPARRAA